jgi:hypothetical protein
MAAVITDQDFLAGDSLRPMPAIREQPVTAAWNFRGESTRRHDGGIVLQHVEHGERAVSNDAARREDRSCAGG